MTERNIPSRHAADLDTPDSPHALLWFLVITHKNIVDDIRVVSDYFDYAIDGKTYLGMPFSATPMTDSENTPSAELRVQNVDRRIGEAIEYDATGARPMVSAFAHSSADFDLTAEPRVPLDPNDLPYIYRYEQFELSDVQVDEVALTGRITMVDISQEPWPFVRATQDRFPGLFV